MQRYRECHDLYHASIGLPVDGLSEIAVKAFEFANLGLPMTGFAAALGHLRLSSARRERYFKEYLPWALRCGGTARSLITVYWEERWEQDIEELRGELGSKEIPVDVVVSVSVWLEATAAAQVSLVSATSYRSLLQ